MSMFETYRWDIIFKSSSASPEFVSISTDGSGTHHVNLVTGNNLLRWQILLPTEEIKSEDTTWNVHAHFRHKEKTTYMDSFSMK